MSWQRRRDGYDPPRDVRIIRPGLPDVKCGVLRDPSGDKKGDAAWVAVPIEPVMFRVGIDKVEIGYVPAHSIISLEMPVDSDESYLSV
jgi:hypothetical protein